MKTFEKMFQKNRLRLAVFMAAVGMASSLHAAGLENGLASGPGKETKDSLKSEVKVPLKSALVKLNTKAGAKKGAVSHHYGVKNGKVYDDLVWFPAIGTGSNCDPSHFNLNQGTLSTNPPSGCEGGTNICCAIAYPLESCEQVPGAPAGVYRVKTGMTGTSVDLVNRSPE